MNDRWGSFDEVARLRERITVIETNLPQIRQQLSDLRDGQAANRQYSETKLNELTALIKAVTPVKPNNDRVFNLVLIVGAIVTLMLLLFVIYWISQTTGGRLT